MDLKVKDFEGVAAAQIANLRLRGTVVVDAHYVALIDTHKNNEKTLEEREKIIMELKESQSVLGYLKKDNQFISFKWDDEYHYLLYTSPISFSYLNYYLKQLFL
jgi:hypothetical protein